MGPEKTYFERDPNHCSWPEMVGWEIRTSAGVPLPREEFSIRDVPPDAPAMSTGPVTAEFLSAWCRLLDLLSNPEDIPFLSGFIEREIMYRILRGPEGARLRAVATL